MVSGVFSYPINRYPATGQYLYYLAALWPVQILPVRGLRYPPIY